MVTRRTFLGGVGAGLGVHAIGRAARAQDGSVRFWQGRTRDQLMRLRDEAMRAGYRYRCLTVYGGPGAPLYAAVMLKQAESIPQHDFLGIPLNGFQKVFDDEAKQGFGPAMISVTGPAATATVAPCSSRARPFRSPAST